MPPIRFRRTFEYGHALYLAGEVAGFTEDVSALLVRKGIAEPLPVDSAVSPGDTPPSVPAPQPVPSGETAPTLPPEPAPDPVREAADIEADNLSRTTPKSERKKR